MAGKIEIPNELKQDLPPSKWGKVLAATPIVMTVIATMLAGLASSEMTKAQYDRSLAAQLQSKAGDQWNYYQAKKLRSAVARNTLDLLAATAEIAPLTASMLPKADAATINALVNHELPPATPAQFEGDVKAALEAMDNSRQEEEVITLAGKMKSQTLAASLIAARDAALAFDNAAKPINKAADKLDDVLMPGDKAVYRSFSAARLRYVSARYETEARLNQAVALIYELQVRHNNFSAERHHRRSGKFFFGMLAAQMGVIIATFSVAARQKSFLWLLAAAAGVAAVAFSLYVYLCI